MYYLKSRYYSPELCRFISADSIELIHEEPMKLTSKNLYAYCDNNPVSKLDPNGRSAIAVLTAFVIKNAPKIIGAAVSVGAYVMSSAMAKEKVTWQGIGIAILSGIAANNFLSACVDVAYEVIAAWLDNDPIDFKEVFSSCFLAFGLSMLNLKDVSMFRKALDLENDKSRSYMIDFCTGLADGLAEDVFKDYITNLTGDVNKNNFYDDCISLTYDYLNLIRIYDLQHGI